MPNLLSGAWRHVGPMVIAAAAGMACAEVTVTEVSIGQSVGGRRLLVQRIADPAVDAAGRGPDERPAVAIVAGLDAQHRVGVDVARLLARRLQDEHAGALSGRTVYVLIDANPDGTALLRAEGTPRADFGRAPEPADADGDRRSDEDPGDDLNGDGMITMMRVERPPPEAGLSVEWLADPEDARLMRKPDAAAGEVATHALLIEGRDNDGDGRFNEDGFAGAAGGGVHLDRNFPTLFPEHTDGAGVVPLWRPETRAIVEWLQARTNVQAVLVYGPGDTLRNIPATKQFDESGRVPKGLEEDDKAAFERLAEAYKEATGEWAAAKHEPGGSLTDWAYGDLGVWSLRSSVWGRPKPEKKLEDPAKAEEAADAAAPPTEADALRARGVDPMIIAFLTGTAAERAALISEFDTMSPEEQAKRMSIVSSAPPDVADRVMAIAQGLPDPAPWDGGAAGAGEGGVGEAKQAEEKPKKAGKPKESEDALWLAYLDEQRGGEGFVAWKRFDHPQLGAVEIGGFAPGVRVNPPEAAAADLVVGQAAFVAVVLERLADLEVGSPVVERVGPGLHRVTVAVTNPGGLPTVNAIGRKARRLPADVLEIDVPAASLVGGERVVRMESVAPGETRHASWLVTAPDGGSAKIVVRSPRFGGREIVVRFGA